MRSLIITATALSGLSLAVSLYLMHQKAFLASKVSHSSKRGQISPSTPRSISSLPPDVFSSKYYAVYDYASVSAPLHDLPNLSPSELLTLLIRRNMSISTSSPQARLLRLTAPSDPKTRRSFDAAYLKTSQFDEGDLVCNAYMVKLRTDEKVEFEFCFGVQGRLVLSVEGEGDEVVFVNETIMWREVDGERKTKLPLEWEVLNWVHEYTAWWMLSSGDMATPTIRILLYMIPMTSTAVMPVRSRTSTSLRASRRDPSDTGETNTVQPPPPKRQRLNPLPSRRRKSSPDLLDTTIDSTPSAKVTPSTKLRRPRPLFALSSAHTTSSPPPAGAGAGRGANTPRAQNIRLHHHDIPNSTPALYLNGGRESPDPLDTISPAPAPAPTSAPKPKPNPKISTTTPTSKSTNTPTSAAYRQRRVTQFFKSGSESEQFKPRKASPKPKEKNSRPTRGDALPSSDDPISQSLSVPVPVETADRAETEPEPEKRRSLRSHDGGSRVKSDLALYFPNYDQLISLEPPKTELLSENTVIKLIDDLTEPPIPPSAFTAADAEPPFGNPLANLHNCEVITLPDPGLNNGPAPEFEPVKDEDDPLNEDHFFKAHRRHERQEKQLRNIERDRAQHEKQQLDRLLEELKSQDWLRVLGIGVTGRSISEQDKKLYEPKRDYFIREISAVLQKFKIWKEEEKRRKVDKDKPSRLSASFLSEQTSRDHYADADADSKLSSPPDDNDIDNDISDIDVDILAAQQLLQEARSATGTTASKRPSKSSKLSKPSKLSAPAPESPVHSHSLPPAPPQPPLDPLKPFTSFFSKPHLREQAMSGNRKGRTRLAFGHPVPEFPEKDFELPSDILTSEAIKDCQRKRRRMKRESVSASLGGQ
ncbi:acetyltransferase SAS4-like domain-containing protein [Aspergillus undulatus]|uniref:acetyltransferase SAS4-like domain-containing protein n=1 Tax=Aspergillus undulatus TaxID=1810928 RepID=UPI003CCCDA4C